IIAIVAAGLTFGVGFGMFDANNMTILCQFVSSKYRATAYGIMNMVGVMAGAYITKILGQSADAGELGHDFALLAIIVLIVLIIQLSVLKPEKGALLYLMISLSFPYLHTCIGHRPAKSSLHRGFGDGRIRHPQ